MSEADDIKGKLNTFIQQEETLLAQLFAVKRQIRKPSSLATRNLFSEGAGIVASNYLQSHRAGKGFRTLAKILLDQPIRNYKQQEETIQSSHLGLIDGIESFLRSVSVMKAGVHSPNSLELLQVVEAAQDYTKPRQGYDILSWL